MLISSRNGSAIEVRVTQTERRPMEPAGVMYRRNTGADGPTPVAGVVAVSLLTHHLLHVAGEGIDVRFVDHLARHDDDAVFRNAFLLAFEVGSHQLHAAIAPL